MHLEGNGTGERSRLPCKTRSRRPYATVYLLQSGKESLRRRYNGAARGVKSHALDAETLLQ